MSKLLTIGLTDCGNLIDLASENLKFASAVAEFGLLLCDSRYKKQLSLVRVLARGSGSSRRFEKLSRRVFGYRQKR